MHADFNRAVREFLHREGIVKVLCIKGVDGTSRDLGEVAALRILCLLGEHRAAMLFEPLRISDDAGREVA